MANNPITVFEEIKNNFELYVMTRFATKFPSVEEERKEALKKEGLFYKKPLVELIQKYKSSGKKISDLNISDLKGLSKVDIKKFQSFVLSGLIKDDFELYEHQYQMLKRVLKGENIVITSGTGSGKTESFLLPLFAYLIKESSSWEKPNEEIHPNLNDWWKNDGWKQECKSGNSNKLKHSYRISQRKHEKRASAVRSLILYPMNALVEDQLSRLRKGLSSENVESYFTNDLHFNRFYFGRYTGMTPVSGLEFSERRGNPKKEKIEELSRFLEEIDNLRSFFK